MTPEQKARAGIDQLLVQWLAYLPARARATLTSVRPEPVEGPASTSSA
jgi:hypothetical protein